MTEDFLQTIWKNRWYSTNEYTSTDGHNVKIISPGYLNENDGPDFTDAKIEIDGLIWCGNIEIHVSSSDWNMHGHSADSRYNNVILHVVKNANKEVYSPNGVKICTITLKYNNKYEQNFLQLINSVHNIACTDLIKDIEPIHIKHSLTQLASERLKWRCKQIQQYLNANTNDWESAFYTFIAKYFGFGINNDAFEQLAHSIPINILSKHCGNIFQLEALFFGQAGLLQKPYLDEYHTKLAHEYSFLQEKYNITPIASSYWRFMRVRPSNFPTIRIAQFVALLNRTPRLFEQCLKFTSIDSLKNFLTAEVSEYWINHYIFAKTHKTQSKHIGDNSTSLLLINAIIPFIFSYGKYKADEQLCERALSFFEKLAPESNHIISKWISLGVEISNAMESQAVLHLNTHYCQKQQCSKCTIGQRLLTIKRQDKTSHYSE